MNISFTREERVRSNAGGGSEMWKREYSFKSIDGSTARFGIWEEGLWIIGGMRRFVYPAERSEVWRAGMWVLYVVSAMNTTFSSLEGNVLSKACTVSEMFRGRVVKTYITGNRAVGERHERP